jgi:hypothetical protein
VPLNKINKCNVQASTECLRKIPKRKRKWVRGESWQNFRWNDQDSLTENMPFESLEKDEEESNEGIWEKNKAEVQNQSVLHRTAREVRQQKQSRVEKMKG